MYWCAVAILNPALAPPTFMDNSSPLPPPRRALEKEFPCGEGQGSCSLGFVLHKFEMQTALALGISGLICSGPRSRISLRWKHHTWLPLPSPGMLKALAQLNTPSFGSEISQENIQGKTLTCKTPGGKTGRENQKKEEAETLSNDLTPLLNIQGEFLAAQLLQMWAVFFYFFKIQ